jgi:hypothetical protein
MKKIHGFFSRIDKAFAVLIPGLVFAAYVALVVWVFFVFWFNAGLLAGVASMPFTMALPWLTYLNYRNIALYFEDEHETEE